ncbi:MAG: PKD domain-containing protein, partial [Thermoplasmata archaeon]|nr:PKD domain-containing protein [Thermoplasmata archaeon]
ITDAAGAFVNATENITTALNLSAFANVSFGASPLPVGFASHVSGGTPGYHFAWAFGDGGTSQLSSPGHVYSSPGVYRATVLVTDQAGNYLSDSWNVTVASGGGPIQVTLAASSAEIALGGADSVTATVAGGQGAYTLRWTDAPIGCHETGLTQLNCTPISTGTIVVSLTVTDSQGVWGNATTEFEVGGQHFVGPIHTGPSVAAGGISPLLAAATATVAALIAILIGVAIGRGRRSGGPPRSESVDPKYAPYRAPGPSESPPAASADPVDDLF